MVVLGAQFARGVKRVFLGKLRPIEVEHLVERFKYQLMETCLAMTMFRADFGPRFFLLVSVLMFAKAFHWLCRDRIAYLEQATSMTLLTHVRQLSLMVLLLIMDVSFVMYSKNVIQTEGRGILLMFLFEYMLLTVLMVAAIGRYLIITHHVRMAGRWEEKGLFLYYLEIAHDAVHLSILLFFFAALVSMHGLPIHMIRDIYLTFASFRRRLSDFSRYRKATANMESLYEDATPEELAEPDVVCTICWLSMDSAKKLPCGHMYHLHCLRTWLERQQTCPVCRASVLREEYIPHAHAHRNANNNNNNNNNNNANANANANANPAVGLAAAPAPAQAAQAQPQPGGDPTVNNNNMPFPGMGQPMTGTMNQAQMLYLQQQQMMMMMMMQQMQIQNRGQAQQEGAPIAGGVPPQMMMPPMMMGQMPMAMPGQFPFHMPGPSPSGAGTSSAPASSSTTTTATAAPATTAPSTAPTTSSTAVSSSPSTSTTTTPLPGPTSTTTVTSEPGTVSVPAPSVASAPAHVTEASTSEPAETSEPTDSQSVPPATGALSAQSELVDGTPAIAVNVNATETNNTSEVAAPVADPLAGNDDVPDDHDEMMDAIRRQRLARFG